MRRIGSRSEKVHKKKKNIRRGTPDLKYSQRKKNWRWDSSSTEYAQ
jgi:hypothetical protein